MERLSRVVVENVAVARQPDRGLHHLLQRELAPMFLCIHQARHRSWDADRLVTKYAHSRNHVALGIQVHIGGRFGGRFLAVVEEVHLAVGPAEEQEAASADVAGLWKHHREGESDRHRGVDGVAALPHDRGSRLGRLGLQRGHHCLRRMHRMHPIAGEGLSAKSQRKYQHAVVGVLFS